MGPGHAGLGRGQPELGMAGRFIPHGPCDPGSRPPLRKPTHSARCFPTTSSEPTSRSSPTPDVKCTGVSPEPPPTP